MVKFKKYLHLYKNRNGEINEEEAVTYFRFITNITIRQLSNSLPRIFYKENNHLISTSTKARYSAVLNYKILNG